LTLFVAATIHSSLLAQGNPGTANLRHSFVNPPDDCRIMMRWWWFGPAVTKPELRRELEEMKADGIGGVEIANLYPLALDDPATGIQNQPYLSDEHIEMLRYAATEARSLGMRVDITLGSGWPFGGPHIPVTQTAGMLRVETVKVPEGASSVLVPYIETGEKLLAAFLFRGDAENASLASAHQLGEPRDGRVQIPGAPSDGASVLFFIASRTGMMVKRPSVGAAGFVLDHYDRAATENHLHAVGDRLLQAFGDQPPYAVFSDSLEVYGSNWTSDLLQEFRARRGYDLIPYLPALVGDIGRKTAAVRHDWGETLTDLANEDFLVPVHNWAQQHHTLFRSQSYGYPPVTLSSNQYEDLPEGEGKSDLQMWRHFSDTRWAASAGHLFGSNVISSETWTWLHSPALRGTPLDMKAEADLHFLQGINQLVGHGWPYSPESAGDPGWTMYAAGDWNNHNPWSFVFSDLTKYLQRVSYALRQGKPANDVALLLPNDDAWSAFHATAHASSVTTGLGFNTAGTTFSIDESMDQLVGQTVIAQVLDAGFNLDFIDGDAIDQLGIPYRVLILPDIDRIPVSTYRKIQEYAKRGGIVIATRRLPATAPGLLDAEKQTAEIGQISSELFRAKGSDGHLIEDENGLGQLLASLATPSVTVSSPTPEIGFLHRILPNADLYFIANTSNRSHRVHASFHSVYHSAEVWDAMTGQMSPAGEPTNVELDLQPYESRLVYLANEAAQPRVPPAGTTWKPVEIDLKSDWTLTFKGLGREAHLKELHSWSDLAEFKYYSGEVAYRKTLELGSKALQRGEPLYLDFGSGTVVDNPSPLRLPNMRAYLESPVREAAEVYVNGARAGVVWHPPYALRIDQLLKLGKNDLTIVVGNTAINSLAGRSLPDYRLLKARYGNLFSNQDMENLTPLPSGILGDLRLTSAPPE